MSAGVFNIAIEQYATLIMPIIWTQSANTILPPVGSSPLPVNLTGYTVMMQIRPYPLSNTILYDASSNIVLGGVNGTITLTIPAATTLTFTWWTGVYDLLLTSPTGFVTRLLEGTVTVTPGVTP